MRFTGTYLIAGIPIGILAIGSVRIRVRMRVRIRVRMRVRMRVRVRVRVSSSSLDESSSMTWTRRGSIEERPVSSD